MSPELTEISCLFVPVVATVAVALLINAHLKLYGPKEDVSTKVFHQPETSS